MATNAQSAATQAADFGHQAFKTTVDRSIAAFDGLAVNSKLNLEALADSVGAFFQTLKTTSHDRRVRLMTFSEFGRRVYENGSHGTDHGAAAPMLLVGGRVKAGLVGAHPSLTDLDDGNLRHHTDFRQVYAAVLDRWLGVPSRQILGQEFAPAEIFRS